MISERDRLNALLREPDRAYHFRPEVVPKKRIAFSGVRTLAAVEKYVWYTPSLMYLWGRFSDTPLTDIMHRVGGKVLWYRFDRPLFRGLEAGIDSSWNHILWAYPRDEWDKFADSVLETAQFDIKARMLYTYALQEIQVYDPISVDANRMFVPGRTPRIKIGVFAVRTNRYQIVFPAAAPETQLPAPARSKPDKSLVRLADRFFADATLTDDTAFERYKVFLLQQEDAEFEELKRQFLAKFKKR